MQYTTIFDISNQPATNRTFLLVSSVLAISTILCFIFSASTLVRYIFLVFSLLFIVFSIVIPYWDHFRLAKKLTTAEYEVAEGLLTGYWRKDWYDPSDRTNYSYEAFQVGNIQFGYHRFIEMAGFHNEETAYFPIRNGLWMRIYYLPEQQLDEGNLMNRILRLEVRQLPKPIRPLPAIQNHEHRYN
ncbi:hypothetical protein WBJ53_29415 [Spirosoma sp. SC4-14]|uniref:hypothetical protein n=1 Tax=Spirosoma sp. SC4-14 TaxID=3128900 RepID=UPI0030D3C05E